MKGRLNKDTLKVYPDYHELKDDDDKMSYAYPLVSESKYLLYIGENKEKVNTFEALLMPAFNNPNLVQIPHFYINEILFEFFYYENENFIIYILHGPKLPGQLIIQVTGTNGE